MGWRSDERYLIVRFEERFNLRPDGRKDGSESSLPLVLREIDGFVKETLDLLPVG
jgi:hypothetical protein